MTDEPNVHPPQGPPPPPGAPGRHLRRSVDDRVLGGVAGGLGRYFALDPVLFRVLFATTAVFGGVGLLAYVLCWALIPDEDAVDPLADRFLDGLHARSIPVWLVAGAVVIVVWEGARERVPWGIVPFVVAAAIIAVALSRRVDHGEPSASAGENAPEPVTPPTAPEVTPTNSNSTGWIDPFVTARLEARKAARSVARERRRRAAPVRWGAFGLLVLALGVVAVIDATKGVPIAAYGWVMLAVSLGALVVGGMMRRTPWLNAVWALVAVAILVTFGASHARLRDGTGDRLLAPRSSSALPGNVRLAVGVTTIDLTGLPAGAGAGRVLHVRQGVGTVVINIPKGADVAVAADVHLGSVLVDGNDRRSGFGERTAEPGGARVLTVDVHLAAGKVEVNHVGS